MCLLMISTTGRPKKEYIENGFRNNPDGCGYSWFGDDGLVHWKKNVTLEEAIKASEELPIGFCMHMRWASIGPVTPGLCHPFPITKNVSLALEGSAKAVLYQNGTFQGYNNILMNHLSSRLVMPRGPFSDSRAIAFLLSIHGVNLLKLLDSAGKFVVQTEGKNLGFGDFIEESGMKYSNSGFRSYTRGTGVTTGVQCGTSCYSGSQQSNGTTTYHHQRPIPRPSQPLTDTQRLPTGNIPASDVRETLSEDEFNQLKEHFEKQLTPLIAN
jgi:hypothetical protein